MLKKQRETEGEVLTLDEKGISGYSFGYGQTGMASLGDGRFCFSHEGRNDDGQYTTVRLYQYENGDFCEIQ